MREMAFLKDLCDFSILHRFSYGEMLPNSDFYEKTFPENQFFSEFYSWSEMIGLYQKN